MTTGTNQHIADLRIDLRKLSSQISDIQSASSAHNLKITEMVGEIKAAVLVTESKRQAVEERVEDLEDKHDDLDRWKTKGLIFVLLAFVASGGLGAWAAPLAKKFLE